MIINCYFILQWGVFLGFLVQFTGVEFAEGLSEFSSLFWSAKHEHHKMFVFSLF